MKRGIVITLCVCLCFGAALFVFGGNSRSAKVDLGSSQTYSKNDLNSAVSALKWHFLWNNFGCKLENVNYTGDDFSQKEEKYQKKVAGKNYDNVVVLESDYTTGHFTNKTQKPDSIVPGFQWTMGRDRLGIWHVIDGGYL